MIATLNNATLNGTADFSTISDTLGSLFAELDLHLADAAGTDLVIDETDLWRNPEHTLAGSCTQTFNLVVVARELTQR